MSDVGAASGGATSGGQVKYRESVCQNILIFAQFLTDAFRESVTDRHVIQTFL